MKFQNIKKIYTCIAVILLVILYVIIFRFSAEDAERSSRASVKVTEFLLRIYYSRISGGSGGGTGGGGENIDDIVPLVEGFVRKLAHFTEYMCMGFLSGSIVILWIRPLRKVWLIIVGQLFLSAGFDEFHQYFIPGRFASFKDVMLDTAGGVTGMLLLLACCGIIKCLVRLYHRWRSG